MERLLWLKLKDAQGTQGGALTFNFTHTPGLAQLGKFSFAITCETVELVYPFLYILSLSSSYKDA